jgi:hypothetical protein
MYLIRGLVVIPCEMQWVNVIPCEMQWVNAFYHVSVAAVTCYIGANSW